MIKRKLTKISLGVIFAVCAISITYAIYVPTGGTLYANVLIQEEPFGEAMGAVDIFPDTAECPNGVRWVCWTRQGDGYLGAALTNADLQTQNGLIVCANDTLNDVPTNGSQWNEAINVSGQYYDEGFFYPVNKSLFVDIECDQHNELRVVWQDYGLVETGFNWKGWYSETKNEGSYFTQPSLITPYGGYADMEAGYDMINWDLEIHDNYTYFVWQQNNYSMDQNFNYQTDIMMFTHWDIWGTKITDGEVAQVGTFLQIAENECNQSDLDYISSWDLCMFPRAVFTNNTMHVVYENMNITPAEGLPSATYQQGKSIHYTNTSTLIPLTFSPDGWEIANGTYGNEEIDDITSYWRPRIDNGTEGNLHVTYWIWNLTNNPPFVNDKNVRYVEINYTFEGNDFSEEVKITEDVGDFDINLYSPDIACDSSGGVTISFLHDIDDFEQDYINYTNKSVYDPVNDWNEPYDNISWTDKYNIDFISEGMTPQNIYLTDENSSSFVWHWWGESDMMPAIPINYNVSGTFWDQGEPAPAPPVNTPPTIYLATPANNTNTTDTTPSFVFWFTDPENSTAFCYLYMNSTSKATGWANNNTNKTLTASYSAPGNYTWWINCTDLIDENQSFMRDLLISPTHSTPGNYSSAEIITTIWGLIPILLAIVMIMCLIGIAAGGNAPALLFGVIVTAVTLAIFLIAT